MSNVVDGPAAGTRSRENNGKVDTTTETNTKGKKKERKEKVQDKTQPSVSTFFQIKENEHKSQIKANEAVVTEYASDSEIYPSCALKKRSRSGKIYQSSYTFPACDVLNNSASVNANTSCQASLTTKALNYNKRPLNTKEQHKQMDMSKLNAIDVDPSATAITIASTSSMGISATTTTVSVSQSPIVSTMETSSTPIPLNNSTSVSNTPQHRMELARHLPTGDAAVIEMLASINSSLSAIQMDVRTTQ